MRVIAKVFNGGPVGLDTLAAVTNEDPGTIEDVYEPFLMQLGFLAKTPRGRVLTNLGWSHLGLEAPQSASASEKESGEEAGISEEKGRQLGLDDL